MRQNNMLQVNRIRKSGGGKKTITADSGGSNSASCRLWKIELQKLADEFGLDIYFLHLKFRFSLPSLYRKIRFDLHS
jgi:hypothetical protein